MATGDVVATRRIDRYHVEIRHSGGDWTHVHHPSWQHTTLLAMARRYADTVTADHPGSEVRIVRTTTSEITKLAGGPTRTLHLGTTVLDQ